MVQGGRWQRARRVPSRGCNIWAECCRAGARGVSSGCCAIWYELRADRYEARKGELSPSLQIVQATASIYERGSVSVTAVAAVPLATGETLRILTQADRDPAVPTVRGYAVRVLIRPDK